MNAFIRRMSPQNSETPATRKSTDEVDRRTRPAHGAHPPRPVHRCTPGDRRRDSFSINAMADAAEISRASATATSRALMPGDRCGVAQGRSLTRGADRRRAGCPWTRTPGKALPFPSCAGRWDLLPTLSCVGFEVLGAGRKPTKLRGGRRLAMHDHISAPLRDERSPRRLPRPRARVVGRFGHGDLHCLEGRCHIADATERRISISLFDTFLDSVLGAMGAADPVQRTRAR